MRIGTIANACMAAALIIGVVFTSSSYNARPATADTVNDRSVFYRLLAKYQHGDEIIDFDIVEGCNVRVTRYGDGDRSYDATRDPVIFAKATKDGGAIWQIMPGACGGETTENGLVPADFLPSAIWFENAGDFSFGIAYFTEDAFESSKSELKVLGASIHSASREEWKHFQSVAATNLVDSRPFTWGNPQISAVELRGIMWNKKEIAKWRPRIGCYLVERYHLTEQDTRETLRHYWPKERPRFWMPRVDEYPLILPVIKKAKFDAVSKRRYFSFGHYQSRAFPTRVGGGMLGGGRSSSFVPLEIFPLRSDDGIPWIEQRLETADTIFRDVDLDDGRNRGFAYCYSSFREQDSISAAHLPNYYKRTFVTRVDGEPIFGEELLPQTPTASPGYFLERDEYIYDFKILGFR